MMLMRAEHSDRGDVHQMAGELRAATGKLSLIVDALTAVHGLGEAS